jgi:hypothetical protein
MGGKPGPLFEKMSPKTISDKKSSVNLENSLYKTNATTR